MNEFDFTTLKDHPDYSLTQSERSLMRAKLEELARPWPSVERSYERAVPSPWIAFIMRPFPIAALALLLMVATGGVSFAAENALPGDTLYGLKVRVNEPVVAALALSPKIKADVRIRQAEERLREAELLSARGELDTQKAQQAAQDVKKKIAAASDTARTLHENGDEASARGIRARIAAALGAHAELMDAQSEQLADEPRERLLSVSVAATVAADEASDDADEEGEDEADGRAERTLAQAAKARAEERINALRDLLEKNGVPDETEIELALELDRLSLSYDAAESLTDMDDYPNAYAAYEDVGKRAYRAYTLLRSAQDIADRTKKEVVIVLDRTETTVAARAKGSVNDDASSMTMSLMATTAEEAPQADAFDSEYSEMREPEGKLEFRLRDQSEED